MPSRRIVQQNGYKGNPLRAWVSLRFEALDSSIHERQLLVDTGSPCAVILGHADLLQLTWIKSAPVNSNFGPMLGARLQLSMPELGLTGDILAFGSEHVLQATRSASSDFAGVVGLPLLRLLEYGGNGDRFWLRQAAAG